MHQATSLERKTKEDKYFLFSKAVSWCAEQIFLQRSQFFLWSPVFFAIGIGLYLSLPVEPPIMPSVLLLLCWLFIYGFFLRSKRYMYFPSMIVLLVMAGFLAGQIRTATVYTPMLDKKINTVEIIATVLAVEELEGAKGQRLLLGQLEIEKLDTDKTPRLVRLSYRAKPPLAVGQRIKALASLSPPSTPVMPWGFDFRRYMYFQGIGAVGFIFNAPEIMADENGLFSHGVEILRQQAHERIESVMPLREAAVISALMIGKRGAISEEDQQALRDSGLAHILAISGLHVGLMTGAVFFILRLMMAGIPQFALAYPIKKIAAIAAFIAAIIYMVMAGMTIPTQRAVLMSGAVFLAIILDRSPISLRLVSFSALVVLAVAPESIMSASFHMSFAAVAALVGFYDSTRIFWSDLYRRSGKFHHKIQMYFIGVCLTTLIAGTATGIYALYHFQRFAVLGILANFVAVPLMAFVIMPFGLLAIVLTPFGLDQYAYAVMGFAVTQILVTAHFVANLPFASWTVGAWPLSALVSFTLSGLFLILWKGYGKVLCVPFVIIGCYCLQLQPVPLAMIASSHKLFGFYDSQDLYVNSTRKDKFTRENWERALGLEENSAKLMKRGEGLEVYSCDDEACRLSVDGIKMSVVRDLYALAGECIWADFIIAEQGIDALPKSCNDKDKSGHLIDRFDTWRNGAYGVYRADGGGVMTRSTLEIIGSRPWAHGYSHRN